MGGMIDILRLEGEYRSVRGETSSKPVRPPQVLPTRRLTGNEPRLRSAVSAVSSKGNLQISNYTFYLDLIEFRLGL